LDHGQGVHSAYFHLDTILVREGDIVRRGASLARVGATGLATGPHLHYGIYLHGKDVDPAVWHGIPASALEPPAPTRQRDSAR
jgi:murein DD-endopeptidase MepM/ murein hydrolase activator NlpD